jgi:uncharacterized protein (UPF0264 family)
MAGLLVSVRDADEARAAVTGGAAIVDVKEPARGPLGRADADAWRAVRAAVPAAIPVSVALGELGDGLPPPQPADLAGIAFVKLGLIGVGSDWRGRWRAYRDALHAEGRPAGLLAPPSRAWVGESGETGAGRRRCVDVLSHEGGGQDEAAGLIPGRGTPLTPHPVAARPTSPSGGEVGDGPTPKDHTTSAGRSPSWIAVAYADAALVGAPEPDAVLDEAIAAGCAGILLDTARKGGPSAVALGEWSGWLARAKAAGLRVALAGGLDAAAIARLVPLGPDLFAVRGAACVRGDRDATIEAARVARLVALLSGSREGLA